MSQPIKKHKCKKEDSIKITGVDYCDDCPFLLYNNGSLICSPNDYKFDANIDSKISVPEWCGNKKRNNERKV